MFVDGRFTEGGGEPVSTINPATEERLAEVSTASAADVTTAVRAARRAYEKVWSRMPGAERAKYLFRIARLVQERARELAVLESLDSGMPIRQTRDVGAPAAGAHFFYYAGWADKLDYAGYGADPRPLGVAGQIICSDAPLQRATEKIAPALACGNTVVLKPAYTTPLTALVLAEICQQADLPPGVVNVLPGVGDLGAALVAHDGLATVAFTGSAEVGRQVQRALAGTGRRRILSLTGPADTVIFDDAPLEPVVDGLITGVFAGPLAVGGWSRLLVQQPVAEQVLAALQVRAGALGIGDPLDDNTDVGPITSGGRLARIRELTSSAGAEGAQCWTSPVPLPDRGFFTAPTIFSGVSPAMRIARQEVFGPVLPVLTFRTPDEAVALVNNTPYGRSAAIWTQQPSRLRWTVQQVRKAVVWTNTVPLFDPTAPCGGYGESGLGREGGRAGLEAYLNG
jgi:aldehyde dehydrogenase (NAD+)